MGCAEMYTLLFCTVRKSLHVELQEQNVLLIFTCQRIIIASLFNHFLLTDAYGEEIYSTIYLLIDLRSRDPSRPIDRSMGDGWEGLKDLKWLIKLSSFEKTL